MPTCCLEIDLSSFWGSPKYVVDYAADFAANFENTLRDFYADLPNNFALLSVRLVVLSLIWINN